MTERNELGFVKDINAAIEELKQEKISSVEKIKKLVTLPFSIEDVSSINNYISAEATETIDCNDELYNIAILNDQILEFDETLKSQFEKRHDELVEALMNRMEGVFKMYNEENLNENVQPAYPAVEQPVEVQTPQIEEINPVAPVAEVSTIEPVVPEVVAPVEVKEEAPVIEPVAEVETPVEMASPFDQFMATEEEKEEEEPVVEVPTIAEVATVEEVAVPEPVIPEITPQIEEVQEEGYSVPEVEVPAIAEVATQVETPVEMASPFDQYIAPTEEEKVEETPVVEVPAVAEVAPVDNTISIEPIPANTTSPFDQFIATEEPTEEKVEETATLNDLVQPVEELPVGEAYEVPEAPVTVDAYEEHVDNGFAKFLETYKGEPPVVEVPSDITSEEVTDYREPNELVEEVPPVVDEYEVPEDTNEEDKKAEAVMDHFNRLEVLIEKVYSNQKDFEKCVENQRELFDEFQNVIDEFKDNKSVK